MPVTDHLRGRSGTTCILTVGLFDTHLRINRSSVNFYDILFWFGLQKLTTMCLNSYRNNVDIWNPCRTSMKKGQQWLQPGICRNLFLLVETTASITLMLWTSSFASFSQPPSYGLLTVLGSLQEVTIHEKQKVPLSFFPIIFLKYRMLRSTCNLRLPATEKGVWWYFKGSG